MWLSFPFKNFSMFRIRFTVEKKKTDILILNVMIKNLCNLSDEKTQNSKLDRDLNKWNQGNMQLT